jgi:hypothetical protein
MSRKTHALRSFDRLAQVFKSSLEIKGEKQVILTHRPPDCRNGVVHPG